MGDGQKIGHEIKLERGCLRSCSKRAPLEGKKTSNRRSPEGYIQMSRDCEVITRNQLLQRCINLCQEKEDERCKLMETHPKTYNRTI